MRRLKLFIASLLGLPMLAPPARADELYRFVSIRCVPELHYVSVRIVPIYNLPARGRYRDADLYPSDASVRRLEARRQFFDAKSLTQRPQHCAIPAAPLDPGWANARPAINVDVIGRYSERTDPGSGLVEIDSWRVDIVANGVLVGSLDLAVAVPRESIASVEVEHDGVQLIARICRVDAGQEIPFAGDTDVLRCKTEGLAAAG